MPKPKTKLKKIAFFCPDDILEYFNQGIELKKWPTNSDAIRTILHLYIQQNPHTIKMG